MKVCKRILAGLALLLATAGLLLSLAGGVGVWLVKGPVTAKATRTFERVEAALAVAEKGLDHVKTSLANATERLDSVRAEQRKLAQDAPKQSAKQRLLARTVRQKVAPLLGDANETLHTVAEAAVVVNSVLEDVGNFPFLAASRLDVGRLTEINGKLSGLAPAAWDLSRLLGEPGEGTDSENAGAQMTQVEHALSAMRGLIAEYEPQVRMVRERTEELKSHTLPWITPATVLVSLACFWIALSQISVLCHAWSWWKQ
jgi:hypothetical protein